MRIILFVVAAAVVDFGWAFQFPHQRPVGMTTLLRKTNSPRGVGKTMPFGDPNTPSSPLQEPAHHSEILIGKSPKAIKLRKTLQEIWSSNATSPILIIGPRGSGKASVVEELLERLPAEQTETIHRLPMDEAVSHIDTMLGTTSQPGLLDLLANQTHTMLVLTSFQTRSVASAEELDQRHEFFDAIAQLVTKRNFYSRYENQTIPFRPRIIATCSHEPEFVSQADVYLVKVPALESRTQDMAAIAEAKIQFWEKEYGLENVKMSLEATHRLLDHAWDIGEPELDQELRKALALLAEEQAKNPQAPDLLKSKHMLVQTWNESMRHRLLYEFPVLRRIIQSPWVFDHTLRYIVTPVFIAVLAVLFLGPQTRDHNAALTVFWAGWWPAVMLSYPFLGRIWCSICPFMAVGNLAQEAATSLGGVKLKKWPKWVEAVGAPFAFGLFFAILAWEELWNLPQNGALSAWLLLLITSGAVFNSVQYEKRMWCRHLCPIGAMCRTFGTMSILEVRSFKANCQGCTDPQCYKGQSPAVEPTDTFALKGCTMDLKNNQLRDMGHCTLCMSCVKNCEREVPELNSRPIGLDYGLPWLVPSAFQDPQNLALSQVETNFWMGALLTVLQGSVLVHYMPTILSDLGLDPTLAMATPGLNMPFLGHSLVTAGLLALPGLLSLAADKVSMPLENLVRSLRRQFGKEDQDSSERRTVIEVYETIMKSNKPLKETMQEFDPDGDGMISCWECKRAFSHLELPERQCEILMGLMRRRVGNLQTMTIESWLDNFQQIYLEARQTESNASKKQQKSRPLLELGNTLQTKKSFVEIFDDLDKDNDGFIAKDDLNALLNKNKIQLTDEEKQELFASADLVEDGRLNLFEFMSMMRKIVRVGIQEIGYGYLPLAWASLTAYWLSIGLKELGLTLDRLPNTFFMDNFATLPHIAASDEVVQVLQAILLIGAIPPSIGLTQKLCDDNKIGGIRFGLHAAIQVAGAWATLYLMLSPRPLMA